MARTASALLTYEEIERLVRLLSAMGVHDVRLTGGEPLVRRELWRLVEKLSAIEDVHDLSLTTNGYLLDAPGRRPGARRPAARQRVARLAGARPLLPAHPARLARAGARRPRRRAAPPGAAADQGQRRRAARTSPRPRSCASPSSPAPSPYVVRFIEFMPLDADRAWSRDKVLPNEEMRAMIDAVYPLEAVGRERHGTVAPLAVRRRAGRDRASSPPSPSRSAATATASA